MASRSPVAAEQAVPRCGNDALFTEAPAWAPVGEGWRHLHGNFRELGYSIEWHDFSAERDLDWSRSFHPSSVEICLNLAGHGWVCARGVRLELSSFTAGFYMQSGTSLSAVRRGGERHQFITIELSRAFLERHVSVGERGLHPKLGQFVARRDGSGAVSEPTRLTSAHHTMVMCLRKPPVAAVAQRLWYQSKALEVAATLFYQPPLSKELFCQRQKRLNGERVQKLIAILRENLAEPLSLEEIARRVGCSPFYLSRTFSKEMGMSIPQYLRQLRMEKAAELLKSGEYNVTEAAFEVGYSSLSHFSSAFHEMFGCCPGLYPLQTPSQRAALADGDNAA